MRGSDVGDGAGRVVGKTPRTGRGRGLPPGWVRGPGDAGARAAVRRAVRNLVDVLASVRGQLRVGKHLVSHQVVASRGVVRVPIFPANVAVGLPAQVAKLPHRVGGNHGEV